MRRYMKSDLKRIFKRIPRILFLALLYIVVFLTAVLTRDDEMTTLDGFTGLMNVFGGILPILIGVIEIAFIYGDDFKAKTMQIAIGTGIPRQKIVHVKWLEFMIATAIDMIIFAIVAILSVVIATALAGGLSAGFSMGNFWLQIIMCWVSMIAYLGSVMFVMFWMQGIAVTLLLYILAASSVVGTLVSLLGSILQISRFHLQTYTLPGFIDTFSARFVLGHISIPSLIGILLYMMVGFALASILFKKKELEF